MPNRKKNKHTDSNKNTQGLNHEDRTTEITYQKKESYQNTNIKTTSTTNTHTVKTLQSRDRDEEVVSKPSTAPPEQKDEGDCYPTNGVKHLKEIYDHINIDYSPKAWFNLKRDQMYNKVENFSKHIKRPCSAIFVSISSHGKDNGGIMGSDGLYILLDNIVGYFKRDDLLGIPKIFIIQACKGNSSEPRKSVEDSRIPESQPVVHYCTMQSDVLIAYSTSEGCYSYRHEREGSWFITELNNCVLSPMYSEKHFVEILTICTDHILDRYRTRKKDSKVIVTQTPSFCSTLRKFLRFNTATREPITSEPINNEPRASEQKFILSRNVSLLLILGVIFYFVSLLVVRYI